METFVLVIFFWETTRGYAVTSIPGYMSRPTCEAAVTELLKRAPNERSFGQTRSICIQGPHHEPKP